MDFKGICLFALTLGAFFSTISCKSFGEADPNLPGNDDEKEQHEKMFEQLQNEPLEVHVKRASRIKRSLDAIKMEVPESATKIHNKIHEIQKYLELHTTDLS